MTVSEMLTRISSHELSEWAAYEQEVGQLGSDWDREVQRQIHYQLQALLHTTVALKTEAGKTNPIPEPTLLPKWNDYATDEDEEE